MHEDSKKPEPEELLEVVLSSPPDIFKRFHAEMREKKLVRTHKVPDIITTFQDLSSHTIDCM